jgi:TATA-binding protein-associated factor
MARYLKPEDALSVLCYAGSPAQRSSLARRLSSADVVVCSYDTLRADADALTQQAWGYCVLDEGHAIRNPKSKLSLAVRRLRAAHRLLLSGTPVQNDIQELWALFDFLMPGFLGSERDFKRRYGTGGSRQACTVDALALNALHKAVQPFILRRMKVDVLKDLPPKIIQDVVVDPSPLQQALADAFHASAARAEVEAALGAASGDGGAAQGAFAALQYMRKLCAHPALALAGAPPEKLRQLASKCGGASASADPAAWLRRAEHAPKLAALTQILRDAGIGGAAGEDEEPTAAAAPAEGGAAHRVLVFAQLKGLLDIVERDVFGERGSLPGVGYLRLDGSVEATKRFDVARAFNSDPSVSVLLLTTHVGGLGLNLTSADIVVFLEHDWNPQRDLQAMDRAHRLGQTRCVCVYRLLTRGTLEERIMSLQRFKLDVYNAVVTADNASMATMDTGALLELFTGDKAQPVARGHEGPGEAAAAAAPAGAAAVLAGLQELWDETLYNEEFSLEGFVARVV